MRNTTLILTGMAALGLGVVGGLASNPVMLPSPVSDWREKYRRPPSAAAIDPASADQSYGYGGWPMYPYAMAGLARRAALDTRNEPIPDLAPAPVLERSLPDDPRAREELGDEAGHDDGAAAVAQALARTAGIGEAAVERVVDKESEDDDAMAADDHLGG